MLTYCSDSQSSKNKVHAQHWFVAVSESSDSQARDGEEMADGKWADEGWNQGNAEELCTVLVTLQLNTSKHG